MERYLKALEEKFNSGDPEVKTWLLIRNNYLPFILCGFYVVFSTIIGPAIMKNRKPFKLRMPMIIFNFCIVAVYTISLLTIFYCATKVTWDDFCKGRRVKHGEIYYWVATSVWVIYILKYVELLDTVFFVLRKKENLITFLHVFHHTFVPIVIWITFRTETSGMHLFPGFLNAFVHIIMYSYYGLAAIGPQFKKHLWWKKYLTQLQMIQFLVIIVFVTIIGPLTGCITTNFVYVMDIFFALIFLYLFYKFYQATFQDRKKAEIAKEHLKKHSAKEGNVISGATKNDIATNEVLKKKE